MAVNKSKLLGRLNSLKDKYSRPGVIESKYITDADIARGTISDIQSEIRNSAVNGKTMSSTDLMERVNDMSAAQEDLGRAQRKIDVQEVGRGVAFAKAWEQNVNNYASPMQSTSRINNMATSSSMVMGARNAVAGGGLSYTHLERAREKSMNSIDSARNQLGILALEGPDVDPNKLRVAEQRLGAAEGRVSTIDSRMRVLRRSGMSTESLLDRAQNGMGAADTALAGLNREDQRKQIKEGPSLNINVLNEAIKRAAEDLKKAGKELSDTLEDTSKSAEDVNAAIKKQQGAEGTLNNAQNIKNIAASEGKVIEPGLLGKITGILTNKATDWAGGVADIANATGKGLRHFGVDRRLERFQNQIGLAGIVNDQFSDVQGGLNLDAGAMRRAMGTNSIANSVGMDAKMYERGAAGMDVIETGARSVQNIGIATSDASPGRVAGQAAQSVVNTAIKADNLYTGASAIRAQLATRNASRAVGDATNFVSDSMNQAYIDYSMGAADATIGAGNRNDLLSFGQDGGVRKSLAEKGVGGKNLVKMMGEMGQFGSSLSGADAVYTMNRAAQVQANGTMSSSQFLGMQAGLQGVGGSGAQLDKTLKEAVAAGMESAKNMNQLVQATVDLSQSMSTMGIGGTNYVSQSLTSASQNLTNLDPSQRTGVAANALSKIMQNQTDTSLNLFTTMEYGRLRRAAPNADRNDLDILKKTNVATLQDIKTNKDPNRAAVDAGLFGLLKGKDGQVDMGQLTKLIDAKGEGNMDRATGLFMVDSKERERLTALMKNTPWAKIGLDNQDKINKLAKLSGTGNGAVLASQMAGAPAGQKDLTGLEGSAAAAQKIKAGQAGGTENNIAGGQKNLGGNMDGVANAVSRLSEELPAKFAEAAQQAATDMKAPADIFMKSAGVFDGAVKKFEALMDERLDPKTKETLDKLKAQADTEAAKVKK